MVEFTLHQQDESMAAAKVLDVVYTGEDPLPDTFRDKAQALCGRVSCAPTGSLKPPRFKRSAPRSTKPSQVRIAAPVYGTEASGPTD